MSARKTTPKAKQPKKTSPLAKSHGRRRGSPLAHGAIKDPFKGKGAHKI
jgi:hypothetical protein